MAYRLGLALPGSGLRGRGERGGRTEFGLNRLDGDDGPLEGYSPQVLLLLLLLLFLCCGCGCPHHLSCEVASSLAE